LNNYKQYDNNYKQYDDNCESCLKAKHKPDLTLPGRHCRAEKELLICASSSGPYSACGDSLAPPGIHLGSYATPAQCPAGVTAVPLLSRLSHHAWSTLFPPHHPILLLLARTVPLNCPLSPMLAWCCLCPVSCGPLLYDMTVPTVNHLSVAQDLLPTPSTNLWE
jgi:hypothetical protein